MKPKKHKTLEKRIAERIARKKGDVFLRRDFEDLGAYDQVGRGLRRLAAKGRLVRLGYGIYARATVSPLSGRIVPAKPLPALAREALARLNVETAPSEFERAYGEGRTAQVPTGSYDRRQGPHFPAKSVTMANSLSSSAFPDPALLEAVATELGVDPSFVEKDWHATQAIAAVAGVVQNGLRPVFSGGTSLSKGYGLIRRFSEDLDFKLLMPEAGIDRSERRRYRKAVIETLRAGGGRTLRDEDILVGNESRFFQCQNRVPDEFRSCVCSPPGNQAGNDAVTPGTAAGGATIALPRGGGA